MDADLRPAGTRRAAQRSGPAWVPPTGLSLFPLLENGRWEFLLADHQAQGADSEPSWVVSGADGQLSEHPSGAERQLADLAGALLADEFHSQGQGDFRPVRIEVYRAVASTHIGYLYLRGTLRESGEHEWWACWGSRDHVDARRGHLTLRPTLPDSVLPRM